MYDSESSTSYPIMAEEENKVDMADSKAEAGQRENSVHERQGEQLPESSPMVRLVNPSD
jgi:hypothetical protein